jgi:hypothetical protein
MVADALSQANPVFVVINLAAFAAGMVPNPIAMAVSLSVQVANGTVKEVVTRRK